MITKKEAKVILKTHPHYWYHDRFGTDLVCKICGCNMEGMEEVAVNVPANIFAERFNDKALKNRQKLHKQSKIVISEDGHILTPRSWFREKVSLEDPEDGVSGHIEYTHKKEWEIRCPNCKALRIVFSHSLYEPLWCSILEFIRTNSFMRKVKWLVCKEAISYYKNKR